MAAWRETSPRPMLDPAWTPWRGYTHAERLMRLDAKLDKRPPRKVAK